MHHTQSLQVCSCSNLCIYRQLYCPTCTKHLLSEAPLPKPWKLPAFTPPSSPPLPCSVVRERTLSRALAADIWCWKANWVHQCVSDPQEKQRQLPFTPSGSSLITYGINPELMLCRSPADPKMPCRNPGPRLQAGRPVGCAQAYSGSWCDLSWCQRAANIWASERGLVFGAVPYPHSPCPQNKSVKGKRDIWGSGGKQEGKPDTQINFASVNLALMLRKDVTYRKSLYQAHKHNMLRPVTLYPWRRHNQCIFLHAQTFQRRGSEIKLPTLFNTQSIMHPNF